MRVIAGKYKGRKLAAPQGRDIRPTTDKAKEAIFSILTSDIPDARVLDLFSGTGALGIEALSRGAGLCIFCDSSKSAAAQIRENLDHCGIHVQTLHRALGNKGGVEFHDREESGAVHDNVEPGAAICHGDIEKTLLHIAELSTDPFDVILMDPPYGRGLCQKAMEIIAGEGLLAEGGILLCEHSKDEKLPEKLGPFEKNRERKYGISMVSIYTHNM